MDKVSPGEAVPGGAAPGGASRGEAVLRRSALEKAFMDPVHGMIVLKDRWILDLVDTPEFQRLRRIRQLGASFATYHGAEHTRFGHSLGALHIMERILGRLAEVSGPIDEEAVMLAKAAALLHDVGHGPLSHALEGALTPGLGHEAWTARILLEDTHLHRRLRALDESLPQKVADVLAGRAQPAWISSLVASQLDVDRMDYLLRDALFTGADYGRFQLDRILHTLALDGERVVIHHKGLQAAEEYVLSRYFMYWRVYLHKTTRGQEVLLRAVLQRATTHAGADPVTERLRRLWQGNGSVGDFLGVDDTDLWVALKTWADAADPVLADLSGRFLGRQLLKPVFPAPVAGLAPDALPVARDIVAQAGFPPESYCLTDSAANVPYDPYTQPDPPGQTVLFVSEDVSGQEGTPGFGAGRGRPGGGSRQPILVAVAKGPPVEISELSPLIRVLARQRLSAVNLYVPAECRPAVRAAVAGFVQE